MLAWPTCLHTYMLFSHFQVMPVHATRILPGSERITTNMPKLMASFDPAKPLTFEVRRVQPQACSGFSSKLGWLGVLFTVCVSGQQADRASINISRATGRLDRSMTANSPALQTLCWLPMVRRMC